VLVPLLRSCMLIGIKKMEQSGSTSVLCSKSSSLGGSSRLFLFSKTKYKEVKKYNSRVVSHSSFERIKYM